VLVGIIIYWVDICRVLTLVVLLIFWSAAHLEHDFHVVCGAAAANSAVDVVLGRSGWKKIRTKFVL